MGGRQAEQSGTHGSSLARKSVGWIAIAAFFGYGLPLFFPPETILTNTAIDASLFERLYPGVPSEWVIARLGCLFVAAVGGALYLRGRVKSVAIPEYPPVPSSIPMALYCAVIFALLHALSGYWIGSASRTWQILYASAFGVPMCLVFLDPRLRGPRKVDPTTIAGCVTLAAFWVLLLFWSQERQELVGNLSDFRGVLDAIDEATNPSFNLITGQTMATVGGLHLLFQGIGIFPTEWTASYEWHQRCHLFWTAITSVAIGWGVERIFGRRAATVATASFLFAPITIAWAIYPAPTYFAPMIVSALIVAVPAALHASSVVAIVATGALAGIAATHSIATGFAWTSFTIIAVSTAWHAARSRQGILALAGLASLASFCAAMPGMPDLTGMPSIVRTFSAGLTSWTTLDALSLEVLPPSQFGAHTLTATGRWWDIPASVALLPFACARSAIRIAGDSIFDPLSAGFLAFACVTSLLRLKDWRAWFCVVFLALSMVSGTISTYDRPSLVRLGVLPVAAAYASAAGFHWLAETRRKRLGRVLLIGSLLTIAAGGGVLALVVDPLRTPHAPSALVRKAIAASDADAAVVLFSRHGSVDVDLVLNRLLAMPVRSLMIEPEATMPERLREASPGLLMWSSGVEDDHQILERVCGWTESPRLFAIWDPARIGRIYAASLERSDWQPRVSHDRWRELPCGGHPSSLTKMVSQVRGAAKRAAASGDFDGARQLLDEAAKLWPGQPAVAGDLAELLLRSSVTSNEFREGLMWSEREAAMRLYREPASVERTVSGWIAAGDCHGTDRTFERASMWSDGESRSRVLAAAERLRTHCANGTR